MKTIIIALSTLILSSLIVGCGGQAAPAPTTAPQAAPTQAQVAPTRPPAAAQPTAPAAAQPTAPAAAATRPAAAPTQPAAPAAGGVLRFELTMTIYDMQPPELTVKVGQKVHWVISNVDTEEHDLVSAGAKLKSILVEGKQVKEVDWVAPDAPGTFEAICTIHREIKPLIIKVVP